MDRVRLGRVLGRGTRLAARTAYEALDAATSSPPAAAQRAPAAPRSRVAPPVDESRAGRRSPTDQPAARPATSATGSWFSPFRRASHAVSLEVTGCFFALFAAPFALALWQHRADVHAGTAGLSRLTLFAAAVFFFAYCALTSFARARRLGRNSR